MVAAGEVLLFLGGGLLGGDCLLLLLFGAAGLGLLLRGLLLIRFRGFIAHNFDGVYVLTVLRYWQFPRRAAQHGAQGDGCK